MIKQISLSNPIKWSDVPANIFITHYFICEFATLLIAFSSTVCVCADNVDNVAFAHYKNLKDNVGNLNFKCTDEYKVYSQTYIGYQFNCSRR